MGLNNWRLSACWLAGVFWCQLWPILCCRGCAVKPYNQMGTSY
jgi:hypothetical protein